jgi:hypothetical protein
MPESSGRVPATGPMTRTVAERAKEARMADCKEREDRGRLRRELGLEPLFSTCAAHGRRACPICRDFTRRAPPTA